MAEYYGEFSIPLPDVTQITMYFNDKTLPNKEYDVSVLKDAYANATYIFCKTFGCLASDIGESEYRPEDYDLGLTVGRNDTSIPNSRLADFNNLFNFVEAVVEGIIDQSGEKYYSVAHISAENTLDEPNDLYVFLRFRTRE